MGERSFSDDNTRHHWRRDRQAQWTAALVSWIRYGGSPRLGRL